MIQQSNTIIENVYQEKYKSGETTGFGDFIRGSYFLMQFCDNNNICYNINILNHPISHFFEKNKIISNDDITFDSKSNNNINKFELTNHNIQILNNDIITNVYDHAINNKFIEYLGKQQILDKKLYVYTIAYPTKNIEQRHKDYMKQLLVPIKSISLLVDDMLVELELEKHKFIIIHIRYGDNFLINKNPEIKKAHFKRIQDTLNNLDQSKKYLVISDNIIMKRQIQLRYPFIKMHFNEITHTIISNNNKMQNTIIDFCLFTQAEKVIAFSVYAHGTGFSKWSSETYSVPYSCTLLS